jgi:serine/threonine protein kinase
VRGRTLRACSPTDRSFGIVAIAIAREFAKTRCAQTRGGACHRDLKPDNILLSDGGHRVGGRFRYRRIAMTP